MRYTIKNGVGHVRLTLSQVKLVRAFYRMKGQGHEVLRFTEAEAYPQGNGWYAVWSKDEYPNSQHVQNAMKKSAFVVTGACKNRSSVSVSFTKLELPKRRRVVVVPAVQRNGHPILMALDRARQAALNKDREIEAAIRLEVQQAEKMRALLQKWGKPAQNAH